MSNKKKKLKELDIYTRFDVPDSSGARDGHLIPKTFVAGGKKYPYDNDSRNSGKIAKVKSRNFANMHGAPTPKGIAADDTRWSTQEAMGVPFNVDMAGRGTGGPHGMPNIPGMGGNWAGRPNSSNFDNHIDLDDEENEKISEFLDSIAGHSSIYKVNPHQDNDEQDVNDVETFKSNIKNKNFGISNMAKDMKRSRMLPGMTYKEQMERDMYESYMSLRDVQTDKIDGNTKHIKDVHVETSLESFLKNNQEAKTKLEQMSEEEVIDFIVKLDPDHFKKSVAKLGKDTLLSFYDEWANQSKQQETCEDIEKMSDRIAEFLMNNEDINEAQNPEELKNSAIKQANDNGIKTSVSGSKVTFSDPSTSGFKVLSFTKYGVMELESSQARISQEFEDFIESLKNPNKQKQLNLSF